VIHSERRDFASAKQMYERAIQEHPSYAEAHCNLGVIHKEEGRLEKAIASYERALAISPEFSIVSNNLAIALTEMGTRVKMAGDWLQVPSCPSMPARGPSVAVLSYFGAPIVVSPAYHHISVKRGVAD
jgi:tetratricopeptide (TPR) repeat protein